MMERRHHVTIDGTTFEAEPGALLLDAALASGIDLPHHCRAGHCGTCCVRLVNGEVDGGEGAEPGLIHACRSRIVADVVVAAGRLPPTRSVSGILTVLRPLSAEVVEAGIKTSRAFPHLPGQYAEVAFAGYPARSFSITHPVAGTESGRMVWFHIRRLHDGHVTSALATAIRPGHRVALTGPFGSAHHRPGQSHRLLLVGTSTGFAPIWSIAVAALRENPQRHVMIIAGGRGAPSLYMGPALAKLARFPNVVVVPVCSAPQAVFTGVYPGRPTDFIPHLIPSDVVYACGAPAMVESVKAIAARYGATCHADPFVPAPGRSDPPGALARTLRWLRAPVNAHKATQLDDRADAAFALPPRAPASMRASTRGHHSSLRA